jgi:cysteine synthase A
MDVLEAIGNTSMVRLQHVVPPGCANVYVKLEGENPTGSMKDRMALGAILRAEEAGRLQPGDTVVEYSGGSTGASLGLVCGARGYRLKLVSSDAFSLEKRAHMAALASEMTVLPSEGGLATQQLFLDMIEMARQWGEAPNTLWFDQLSNPDIVYGYYSLGEEIWSQLEGKVDAFVQCVGTSGSLQGVSTVLRRHRDTIRFVAVEPAESAVLSGGEKGGHRIEGIGIGRRPPLWKDSVADEILAISSADAEAMARRLAREEGLLAGTSSGANVLAAIQVAERLSPDANVVTLMIDSGLKYLSTEVYRGADLGASEPPPAASGTG